MSVFHRHPLNSCLWWHHRLGCSNFILKMVSCWVRFVVNLFLSYCFKKFPSKSLEVLSERGDYIQSANRWVTVTWRNEKDIYRFIHFQDFSPDPKLGERPWEWGCIICTCKSTGIHFLQLHLNNKSRHSIIALEKMLSLQRIYSYFGITWEWFKSWNPLHEKGGGDVSPNSVLYDVDFRYSPE